MKIAAPLAAIVLAAFSVAFARHKPGGFPGMTQADMERDVTGYIRLRRR